MVFNIAASMNLKCSLPYFRRYRTSLKSYSIEDIKRFKRIKPIDMSFNIYESGKTDKDRKPLIVMHGLFGSKSNWNSLSKAINGLTGRKVIAVDARNHGESPHSEEFSYFHLVEDINHLLKNLSISEACVLGHSMGGRAAMLYALVYPESIEKLIVVDISHKSPGIQMTGMRKYFEAMKSVSLSSDLTMSDGRKKANEQLEAFIPEIDIRQFLLTNLIKDHEEFKWRLNIDVLEKAFISEISEFPHIESVFLKPTLFIGGTKSSYLRMEDHDEIKRMFPKAIFKYLDAGHWVHAEKPNQFLEIVNDFLK